VRRLGRLTILTLDPAGVSLLLGADGASRLGGLGDSEGEARVGVPDLHHQV